MRRTLAAGILVALVSCGAFAADDIDAFFPKPQEIAGWAISRDIEHYAGEEIFDRIDGAGEIFLQYNFEAGATAEFTGPEDGVIAVEVYRMKTAADAYGVFTYHKPEKAEDFEVSQAAYASGILGGLWRDVYYVKVYGLEEKPGLPDAVKDFCKLISSKIPGRGILPDTFRVFEIDGHVKGSTRYLHTNLALKNLHFVADENILKLSEKTSMVFGLFVIDKRRFSAFLVVYPTEPDATAAASGYAKFLGKHPDAEATWFRQRGRTIVGTWTGIKVKETQDSEYMIYDTLKELLKQVKILQIDK
ncbi:MAG: hypothetical protein J7M19_04205 [Planctomycetes bacterium]|nr:hypothetical protein [Planctomycetota bacterium]